MMIQSNISLEKVIAALEACSFIDPPDCSKCYLDGPGFGFACRDQLRRNALALLKMQELPTNASISSAIECLLHPQDADDSDMAKAIDTAVRAMMLLKAQEPMEYVVHCKNADLSNGTEFACGECGGLLLHKKVNYCLWCGRAVKWNG